MNAYSGPPMTLGNAAAAGVRLIVWCRDCRHQVEPDPDEMAERYGVKMTVPDWHPAACLRSVRQFPAGRFCRHRDHARAMSRCAPIGGAKWLAFRLPHNQLSRNTEREIEGLKT
jgi:hypothetical protein